MSTAKELFKKVGYEKAEKSESVVLYTNGYGDTISFEENKHVVIRPIQACRKIIMTCLLENAIHKQCEELGWFESKNKQETNFEHYYKDLLKIGNNDFGVCCGQIKRCSSMVCHKCDIHAINEGDCCRTNTFKWLASPYKKPTYKLSQFEYDLIQTYSDCSNECKFCDFMPLNKLQNMGYFNCIDSSIKISDILGNCEIIDDEIQ